MTSEMAAKLASKSRVRYCGTEMGPSSSVWELTLAVNGAFHGAQRFAIDFVQLDADGRGTASGTSSNTSDNHAVGGGGNVGAVVRITSEQTH